MKEIELKFQVPAGQRAAVAAGVAGRGVATPRTRGRVGGGSGPQPRGAIAAAVLLAAVVDPPDSDETEPSNPAAGLRAQVKRRLSRWYRQSAADALRYADLDDAGRHQLRKPVKRLRYAVEFSASLFERRALRLGALSDVAMALAAYEAVPPADPRRWFALGWLAARRDALVAGSVSGLAAFARAKRFWKAG